ncbi:MAG: proton-conducting transporter membrane subunit [Hyphomonadaceae bacterium]
MRASSTICPADPGVVTVIGATTALFAATVGLAQNDIKRVIAYSTCSQLGYMFFAAGVGAYNAAMFHLFTHAFFKALLFLALGSVIHGMHHEQDMRFMGGVAQTNADHLGDDVDRHLRADRVRHSGPGRLCWFLFQRTRSSKPRTAVRASARSLRSGAALPQPC